MSQRNGDKARFGRRRIAKTLLRKHTEELRKLMLEKSPAPAVAAAK